MSKADFVKDTAKFLPILVFFAGALWIVLTTKDPAVLPLGSILPKITYTDKDGNKVIFAEGEKRTLIMFFRQKCEHCRYQIIQLDGKINHMPDINICLFTDDRILFQSTYIQKFSNLAKNENLIWGVVGKKFIDEFFEVRQYPCFFLYNSNKILVSKFSGERKFDWLISEIEKADSPEYRKR